MKTSNSLTLALLALAALLGSIASVRAATFTEAEFTRLENDVKVLKESATPHSAAVGENVKAVTSVATGVNSRAELRFPDQSLTRLGANSRFTIRGEQRTLDLDQGVMLLQVPKKIGGAKVRTAAVTAAVTGTTVIQEYFPQPIPNFPHGYVKLIVVEGTVDFFSNKDPSHFQEVHAGQMIIMDPTSTNIPAPVDIDLKRLLRTSKLLAGYDHMPNASYVNNALQQQQNQLKNGALLNTNLVILGMGTFVSFSNNEAFALNGLTIQNNPNPKPPQRPFNPGNTNNNNNNPPPNNPPPPFQGFLPLISNTTVLNENSHIVTDPQVTAFNSGTGGLLTSQGLIYHGQAIDGALPYFAFGSSAPADRNFQALLNTTDNGWAAFKFENLLINGAPNVTVDGVSDLLLTATGNITLSADNTTFPAAGGGGLYGASWNLGGFDDVSVVSHLVAVPTLTGLALYSQNGSIAMNNFSLTGTSQDIALNAASLSGDVSLVNSTLQTQSGNLVVAAGRNVTVQTSKVQGANVQVSAGQNISVSNSGQIVAQDGNLVLRALNGIQITSSSSLKELADEGARGILRIETKKGPIIVQNSTVQGNNVGIQAFGNGGTPIQSVAGGNILITDSSTVTANNGVKVRTLAPGGTVTVASSTINAGNGVRLYAGSPTGTLIFTQDTTISGKFLALAGNTVEVAPGVTVTVNNNHVKIFANNALYNVTGYGTIISGETEVGTTSSYANRPKFRAPPPSKEGPGSIPRPPKPPLRPPLPGGLPPGKPTGGGG